MEPYHGQSQGTTDDRKCGIYKPFKTLSLYVSAGDKTVENTRKVLNLVVIYTIIAQLYLYVEILIFREAYYGL